jgi:hypothetical protein
MQNFFVLALSTIGNIELIPAFTGIDFLLTASIVESGSYFTLHC